MYRYQSLIHQGMNVNLSYFLRNWKGKWDKELGLEYMRSAFNFLDTANMIINVSDIYLNLVNTSCIGSYFDQGTIVYWINFTPVWLRTTVIRQSFLLSISTKWSTNMSDYPTILIIVPFVLYIFQIVVYLPGLLSINAWKVLVNLVFSNRTSDRNSLVWLTAHPGRSDPKPMANPRAVQAGRWSSQVSGRILLSIDTRRTTMICTCSSKAYWICWRTSWD